MKRILSSVLLTVLVMALAVLTASCGAQASAASALTTAAEQVQEVEAYGVVKAPEVENIILGFDAAVTAVYVKEGQHVKAGQALIALDLSDINTQISNTRAELEASRSDISLNLTGAAPELLKLQNDLKNARNIYEKDLADLDSQKRLYDAGGLSKEELDAKTRLVDADRKNIDDVNFAIKGLQKSNGTQKSQKTSQASILESNLKLLEGRLNKPYFKDSDVISDVSNGLVFDISELVPGDIAGPQKKLLSIMDLDSMLVEANVPEEFIKDVKIDAKATIIPTADKTRHYTGKVAYISGKAFQNNGETLVTVRISIDNRDEFLLPGFNTDVKIEI